MDFKIDSTGFNDMLDVGEEIRKLEMYQNFGLTK